MLYYIWVSFLSAFLLFQIQPIVGRYVLPWFGGTPAVWSTTLLFFQVVLLLGYGYAYWVSDKLQSRRQGVLHAGVIGLSLFLLLLTWYARQSPVVSPAVSPLATAATPTRSLLTMLLLSVGLPYFTLATTSPLIQSWFSQANPGQSPYPLYAYSNAGSLLALVSYPFVIEPAFSLRNQSLLWSAGFVLFALSMGFCASRMARLRDSGRPPEGDRTDIAERPGIPTHLLWLVLAGCASLLLLATTRQISQEVAVIPFLWILPLVLYLLSFILCFSRRTWYSRSWCTPALLASTGVFCWVMIQDFALSIVTQIVSYSLVFFVCCMICHGELVKARPHERYLTSFYLTISAGGALGGVFVTLIAPRIFTGFWELQLGLLLCWILFLITAFRDPSGGLHRPSILTVAMIVASIAFIGFYFFVYINLLSKGTMASYRNFYGVLRIRETGTNTQRGKVYSLLHGAAIHGFQFRQPERRGEPTAYFTADSGVGLAILNHPHRASGLRIGVLGLGIGTLSAYGRPEDTIRFYEINPDVIRLAEGLGGYFTFVSDSQAGIEIIPGDARISLSSELEQGRPQHFDLLVIDTFNSDAIPVHLLTKEAFQLYLAHMRPDGILAANITNKHLDLRPVLFGLAEHFGLHVALVKNDRYEDAWFPSLWCIATRDASFFKNPLVAPRIDPEERLKRISLWTDDYSNLFQILK